MNAAANVAFEVACASCPGVPEGNAVSVANRLLESRGADIAELLDEGERLWRQGAPARGRIADAIRQVADYARHVGDDDAASAALRLLHVDVRCGRG